MIRKARFSKCRQYRYALWRSWDERGPQVMFIGLNPSTADAKSDDPTIRRCIRFAQDWGFGSLCMVNVFAYRSTDPSRLREIENPVGRFNDRIIRHLQRDCQKVILAWGNHAEWQQRYLEVRRLIKQPYCLKVNKSGQPAHPLYLSADLQPTPYLL